MLRIWRSRTRLLLPPNRIEVRENGAPISTRRCLKSGPGLSDRGGRESLLDYRWSSVPGYALKWRREPWLSVERGLSTLQFRDDPQGRR